MARTRGNSQQEAGLEKLINNLVDVRTLDVRGKYKTILTQLPDLWIKVDLHDFPIVRIGPNGGFAMPEISSYKESGKIDTLNPPPDGRTAFDACLYGDDYVRRRGSGAATSPPFNNLPWESD